MTAPALPPKLQLQSLSKAFRTKQVLADLSLDLKEGESLVVIGRSGGGKSVLLKCILGLIPPDKGAILIDGKNVASLRRREREDVRRKFGMLFQGAALFDSLPVWENVVFGLLQRRKVSRTQGRDVAVEKLAAVGLDADAADLFPSALSGGMQKRVGLARAIAGEPEILLFDEPTTGLDPIMAGVINDLIVKCVKGLGATALSITHDMNSACKIADRIAMLHKGRIVWTGPSAQVFNTDNPYVDQFVHGRPQGPLVAGR